MKIYKNRQFDEERALYAVNGALLENCLFKGEADGESALKESCNVVVKRCDFHLRYPFWHTTDAELIECTTYDTCRAAFWYDENVRVYDSRLGGIKAFRECKNVTLENCHIVSAEFGWRTSDVRIKGGSLEGEYPFFMAESLNVEDFDLKGKYSFQYVKGLNIRNSSFDTKDAFWHAENVTVENTVIKGEYLAWYSKNLTLVNCTIIGTQPFCYCENLKLVNCRMEGCDLSFENSFVEADVIGRIDSVKNPSGGYINADSIGEIITDGYAKNYVGCTITAK